MFLVSPGTKYVGNQYEQLKLSFNYPIKFSYLRNNVRRWSQYSARPEPSTFVPNFEWVTEYEPGKYDVAILHLDQQCTDPRLGKAKLYRQLNSVITDIPKIVINHGSPMWDDLRDEQTVINGGEVRVGQDEVVKIDGIKQLVGDNFMIVNSYNAVARWGWGYPVIHGLDSNEWWDLPKEPRASISLSPGGLDKYYNRRLLTEIKSGLAERSGHILQQANVEYKLDSGDNWNNYRDFMGRSLIGVYMMRDSPMPRSRTEAMLSGQCVLSSRYHDADMFIEDGVNGFILPDNPLSYIELIQQMIDFNYRKAVEIGQNAKQTAKKYFNSERYQKDMYYVISQVAKGNKPVWDGVTIYEG